MVLCLEQKDLQAIGTLLNEKLKVHEEKLNEVINIVNDGFTGMQEQIDGLKQEMAKRPTRNEIFGWADRRIDDLELRADRNDFMHYRRVGEVATAGGNKPSFNRARF